MADKAIKLPPEMLERAARGEMILAMSPCACGSPCGSVIVAVLNASIVAVDGSDMLASAFKISGEHLENVIGGLLRHSAEASVGEEG